MPARHSPETCRTVLACIAPKEQESKNLEQLVEVSALERLSSVVQPLRCALREATKRLVRLVRHRCFGPMCLRHRPWILPPNERSNVYFLGALGVVKANREPSFAQVAQSFHDHDDSDSELEVTGTMTVRRLSRLGPKTTRIISVNSPLESQLTKKTCMHTQVACFD